MRLLLALALCASAADPSGPRQALAELKARGVVGKDAAAWTPEEAAFLKRIRRAERLGAIQYIRERSGTTAGAVANLDTGLGYKKPLLTAAGFRRWLFLLSQEARQFFEARGAEAKYVFQTTDLDGGRLFTDDGELTDAGVDLFLAARAKKKVFWRDPGGRPNGTVRPPPSIPLAPPKPLPAEPGKPAAP